MNEVLKVKASGITYTEKLRALVERKVAQLMKLLPPRATEAVFEVELGKATKHHKSGKIHRAEMTLSYGGVVYRAEETSSTIEEAIETVKDELKTEITKRRGKKKEAVRKGGRALKKMVRGE